MQTIEVERARERRMFALLMFLTKRPDIPATEDTGGDGKRARTNRHFYVGTGLKV